MLKSKNRVFIASKYALLLLGFSLAFNGEFILSSAILGFTVLFCQTASDHDQSVY